MSNATRRFARVLVLALVGACLSACHLCGHGYHHGWGGHFHVPVRHCR